MQNEVGTIYLLHFSAPFKHAKHYMGWTTNLEQRLKAHGTGNGSRLVEVITEAGLSFELVRTWEGTRNDERKLKNGKRGPRLCPICTAKEVIDEVATELREEAASGAT